MQNMPPYTEMHFWAAWNATQTEIIGKGFLMIHRVEENQHLAHFNISVLPEYRRQGIAREIFRYIVDVAQQEKRRMLMTIITDRVPGVAEFITRLGAFASQEGHSNQLQLKDLDRDLLARWLTDGQRNNAEFELGYWDGAYPEDKLQAMVELHELVNQIPLGDLQVEAMHTSPAQLRQTEKNLFSGGCKRWTFYLIYRATGKFVGYTETTWNPNRPEFLQQDMTGVFPEYRNKGLGRWLKAAMLDKVLKELPQVKYIRSHNADSNAAMLKINNELGFKPYIVETLWQIETQKVLEYLQTSL
jgi:GNAT superfamily N-acetyltransferase